MHSFSLAPALIGYLLIWNCRLKSKNTKGEAVMLRAYAKKYFPDILSMLVGVDTDIATPWRYAGVLTLIII